MTKIEEQTMKICGNLHGGYEQVLNFSHEFIRDGSNPHYSHYRSSRFLPPKGSSCSRRGLN